MEYCTNSLTIAQLLETFVPPPIDYDDQPKALATLRHSMSLAERSDVKDPEVEEETIHAPARDGYDIPLRVRRPVSTSANAIISRPLLVLYFGGGNVVGNPAILASLARPLAKRHDAVVVAPTYRLAPDNPSQQASMTAGTRSSGLQHTPPPISKPIHLMDSLSVESHWVELTVS